MYNDDGAFVEAFEKCEIPNQDFHHRDHIRLAWIYLQRYPAAEAERRIEESIRRYAAHHGASQKYHQTITIAWMRVVAAAMREARGVGFDRLIQQFPDLLAKETLGGFYSPAVLQSDAARIVWIEPDIKPLPDSAPLHLRVVK